jgi:spermidine/putrescine transport system permease protein
MKLHSNSRRHFIILGIIAPAAIWLTLFLVLPYANLFAFSFWKNGAFKVVHEFTLDNYIKFFTTSKTGGTPYLVLLDTIKLSLWVTLFTLLISFPLAYFIRFQVKKYKQQLYMLVIIPMWVSYIMRAYSWKIILGTNGILNSFLLWAHLINSPLSIFLYSKVSVIIAMTHIYTPFVLMPIYTALEQLPENLIEASSDLGANPARTFIHVVFPLALPGVITGATYAFVLSMGDFLAPSLLGGPTSSTQIANIVQQQFGTSNNWPYGAAIGIVILIMVLVLLGVTDLLQKRVCRTTK